MKLTFYNKQINLNYKKIYLSIYIFLVMLFFIHQVHLPLSLLPIAGHDDGLFMSMGERIAFGHWLGGYNQFTLMKGVGLPFILAILSIFKIPVTFFYTSLIVITCELLRRSLNKWLNSYYISALIALMVMWYPGLDSTRLLRDTLFTWETVLAFVCFVYFTINFTKHSNSKPLNFLGILLGYLFITREEGVTVILPVVALVALLIFVINRHRDRNIFHIKRKISLFSVFVLCVAVPWIVVSSINYLKYGKFIDNDFKETNFVNTLTLLQSVKSNRNIDFLPVPKDVRELLYANSPKFSELKSFLDSENAPLTGWQKPPCERFPVTCGDYGGPWFFWALRDAVFLAGHYKSPAAASDYYKSLNSEIQNLCESKIIECNKKLLPLPNISDNQWKNFPKIFATIITNITLTTPPPLYNMPSMGNADQLRKAADFLSISNYVTAVGHTEMLANSQVSLKDSFNHPRAIFVKSLMFKIYSIILPILLVCGLLSVLLLIFVRPYSIINTIILTLAWGLPFIRILMLAVTTTSGFGDIFHFYIGFSGPLLIVASMLSIFLLGASIKNNLVTRSINFH